MHKLSEIGRLAVHGLAKLPGSTGAGIFFDRGTFLLHDSVDVVDKGRGQKILNFFGHHICKPLSFVRERGRESALP